MSAWLIALAVALPAAINSGAGAPAHADLSVLRAYVDGENALERTSEAFMAEVGGMRALGPRGLDDAFALFAADVRALREGESSPRLERVRDVLDAIAQQRDAYAAQLYWETDLEVAKARAATEHKPVLSLRMLGKLSDDLSCANSRFFRTLLYPELAARLRAGYVLHWQSVRAVPVVTIDMGDGRTLKTTVAGNSVHVVIDAQGTVIDAMPGLVDVPTFRTFLEDARQLSTLSPAERSAAHHKRAESARRAYRTKAGRDAPALGGVPTAFPQARSAARLALTKAFVERPVVEIVNPEERAIWRQTLLVPGIVQPDANGVGRLAPTTVELLTRKLGPDQGFDVARLDEAIARDTALNLYGMRPVIDDWLASDSTINEKTLTERLYDTLFETPSADPWLGLLPQGVYTGVEHGGVGRR